MKTEKGNFVYDEQGKVVWQSSEDGRWALSSQDSTPDNTKYQSAGIDPYDNGLGKSEVSVTVTGADMNKANKHIATYFGRILNETEERLKLAEKLKSIGVVQMDKRIHKKK